MDSGYYIERVTIEDVRAAKPKGIYYSMVSMWWTHLENARGRTGLGIRCDPAANELMYTEDVEGFLTSAEESSDTYGKHGLRAFMAAHSSNTSWSVDNPLQWCSSDWDDYNRLIDEADRRIATVKKLQRFGIIYGASPDQVAAALVNKPDLPHDVQAHLKAWSDMVNRNPMEPMTVAQWRAGGWPIPSYLPDNAKLWLASVRYTGHPAPLGGHVSFDVTLKTDKVIRDLLEVDLTITETQMGNIQNPPRNKNDEAEDH